MSAYPLWDDGVPSLSMPSPLPLGISVPQIRTPSLIVADSASFSDLLLRCLPVCCSAYSLKTRTAYIVSMAEVPSLGSKVLAAFREITLG